MKKIILLLLTLIATIPVFGQTHLIGFVGGVNIANIDSETFKGVDSKIGINSGLTYEYKLNKEVSIGADLLYTQRGFKSDVIFNDTNDQITSRGVAIVNYNYLSLPLKFGAVFGNRLSGFVNLGIVPSIFINGKSTAPGPNGNEVVNKFTDGPNRFDFGGIIEAGSTYKLDNNLLVFASFAYQRSFTKAYNSRAFKHTLHYGMAISAGLKYILPTKE